MKINIGSEKKPEVGVGFQKDTDRCSHAFGEVVFCFWHLTKDTISQPFGTQKNLETKNDGGKANAIGFTLYVFDLNYQKSIFSLNL